MTSEIEALELSLARIKRGEEFATGADIKRIEQAIRKLKRPAPAPIMIECQYTGIVFQAESKRQKNHPRVSVLLNDLARDPAGYHTAKERFAEARANGMCDLEEIIQFVKTGAYAAAAEASAAQRQRDADRRDAAKDRHYAKNARDHQNSILRAAGYRWTKQDEESMDAFGASAFQNIYGDRDVVWTLSAPDGREVSVRTAMEEIASAGGIQAQQWLTQNPRKGA